MIVPSLYAATSREAAAHETVFHDIEANDPIKSIRKSIIESRTVSTIKALRDFEVAPLFSPELLSWGLRRQDLIDTSKNGYIDTVVWAQAIHHSDESLDGLIWVSRRCDTDRCIMLFGDRVAETDLQVLKTRCVAGDPGLMREFRRYGQRAGITIVAP